MFDLSSDDYTGESKFSQLNAGIGVPAKLTAVAVDDQSGDLIFSFKGTDEGDVDKGIAPNNGSFNHRVWANNFDPDNEYYDETWAKRYVNQTKHILKAFLSSEVVDSIKGKNWLEFANAILGVMPEASFKDIPVSLKVLLDNKNRPQFPVFPDFISSPLMPKSLKMDTRLNPNTGRPYERITPIELADESAPVDTSFGAVAAAANPDDKTTGTEPTKPAFA